MLELLKSNLVAPIAVTAGSVGLAWVLKKIPNEKIKKKVGQVCYAAGVACTLGLSKWKWSSKYWNKTIEPWIIDLIDNVVNNGIEEFTKGLRSDKK